MVHFQLSDSQFSNKISGLSSLKKNSQFADKENTKTQELYSYYYTIKYSLSTDSSDLNLVYFFYFNIL